MDTLASFLVIAAVCVAAAILFGTTTPMVQAGALIGLAIFLHAIITSNGST